MMFSSIQFLKPQIVKSVYCKHKQQMHASAVLRGSGNWGQKCCTKYLSELRLIQVIPKQIIWSQILHFSIIHKADIASGEISIIVTLKTTTGFFYFDFFRSSYTKCSHPIFTSGIRFIRRTTHFYQLIIKLWQPVLQMNLFLNTSAS